MSINGPDVSSHLHRGVTGSTPVNDYQVEQVKSLLDHQINLHETTSLSRAGETSRLGAEDLINHGSVQHAPSHSRLHTDRNFSNKL